MILVLSGVVGIAVAAFVLFVQPRSLTVTRVIDGDTIVLSDGRHIRLIGIDAPEEGECYAGEAAADAAHLLLGQNVHVETDVNELDQFGRTLAYVTLAEGSMVNRELLDRGAGMFFYDSVNLRHQQNLIEVAESARVGERGLWRTCGPCVVKGNYDTSGHRFYHLPQFRHYPQVVVNLDDADRWFCSEADAAAAGFTRARE